MQSTFLINNSSLQITIQEELMFEDIANPLKGKGKEKDVGKRRAYVRVVTSLGGSSLNLELFCEKVGFSQFCLHAAYILLTRLRKHAITF